MSSKRRQILKMINDQGFIWDIGDDILTDTIFEMHTSGELVSLEDLNIPMMNSSYCFTLKGNPHNVRLKIEEHRHYTETSVISDLTSQF